MKRRAGGPGLIINNKEKGGLGSKQRREGSRVSMGKPIVEDRPLETGWEEGGPGIIK